MKLSTSHIRRQDQAWLFRVYSGSLETGNWQLWQRTRYRYVVFCRTDTVLRFEEHRLALSGHVIGVVQLPCPDTDIVVYGANCPLGTVQPTPK